MVNVASSWSRGIRRKYHHGSILESSCGFVKKTGRHPQHGKKRHACRLCVYDPGSRDHHCLGYCDGHKGENAAVGAELAYAVVDFVYRYRRDLVSRSLTAAARNDPP